jgi:hypothetical protein
MDSECLATISSLVRGARDALRGSLTLYRAVSQAEYDDIKQSARLESVPEAMEDHKWFAERCADAFRWGEALYGDQPFHIIKARWPRSKIGRFTFLPNLDHIGPARCAPREAWPDAKIAMTLRWWDRL